MKARLFFLLAATALVARTASAQDTGTCPAGNSQDACQKAVDLFNYMAPQLGVSITGGNAMLGQGGSLGGLGHFSLGIRGNVVQGTLPEIGSAPIQIGNAGAPETYETNDQLLGMPVADLAVGIFKGLPLGLTNVGGIDLLVSASYLPEFDGSGVQVQVPDGSLKLGYGARVGILQESLLTPGISVTYLRRDLPTVNIKANGPSLLGEPDTLFINDLRVETNAWRVVASKSFLFLGLAVGAGQDSYRSGADVSGDLATGNPLNPRLTVGGARRIEQSLTRTNYFADVSLNLLLFKITGEIGQVSGGEVTTYNQFEGKQAADSRIYGSVGARFGF